MSLNRIVVPIALGALVIVSSPALSQTPTAAQQQAIRSSCVADYRANCSSVPTGGMASLVCLEQHESKLSPSCKSAVEAVDSQSAAPTAGSAADAKAASNATKPEAKPSKVATTAEKPETETAAAPKASDAAAATDAATVSMAPKMSFRGEMRLAAGACARDFRLLCPNLPVGHGNVLFCLKVHGPKLDATCRNALLDAGEVF
ncbi:MAG: hypothetical protein NXI27_25410 [Alphaproteobacteria bacterium]|nr:hypothetical protein [Alphaproteobacteria bacterium]